MTTITSPITIVSPSCSFKLFFCKSCKQSIDTSTEVKCDDCQNYFHKSCVSSNQNQIEGDLIQLCHSCTNENRVCTPPKRKFGTNTIDNEISITPMGIRNLRTRAVSIDSRAIISKVKQKKNIQQLQMKSNDKTKAEHDAKLKLLESRIEKLENASCNCLNGLDDRIVSIEKSIRENKSMLDHANRSLDDLRGDYGFLENSYFNLEKRMHTLTTVVAKCDAYQIQIQLSIRRFKSK